MDQGTSTPTTGTATEIENISLRGQVWAKGKFTPSVFTVKKGKISPGTGQHQLDVAYIIPPFADPHIHGGWGLSFQQGDFSQLEKRLKSQGIFWAIPTLDNNTIPELKKAASRFKAYQQSREVSIFPFLRVEGPFISSQKKGFQRGDFILPPNPSHIKDFLAIEEVKFFSFAPELKGAELLVRKAQQSGKILSVGHSQADFHDFIKFYRMGVKHFTHYPNAMSGLHHREIGLLGAGLLLDDLQLEVIADGIHSTFEFISLLLKIRGPVFCITSDLIPPAHSRMQEFDGRRLKRTGKRIVMGNGTLAGGGTTVPEQVQWLSQQGLRPDEIIPLACVNALKMLGRRPPSLTTGKEATFLVLDDNMKVSAVVEKGKLIRGKLS